MKSLTDVERIMDRVELSLTWQTPNPMNWRVKWRKGEPMELCPATTIQQDLFQQPRLLLYLPMGLPVAVSVSRHSDIYVRTQLTLMLRLEVELLQLAPWNRPKPQAQRDQERSSTRAPERASNPNPTSQRNNRPNQCVRRVTLTLSPIPPF
jgi:hypothetical protein